MSCQQVTLALPAKLCQLSNKLASTPHHPPVSCVSEEPSTATYVVGGNSITYNRRREWRRDTADKDADEDRIRPTCGSARGPFRAGCPACSASIGQQPELWLEEPCPFTSPCSEWFSWASLSTRALASWKRQLRNSRSCRVLCCQPSISSQRCRRARLLHRRASRGEQEI